MILKKDLSSISHTSFFFPFSAQTAGVIVRLEKEVFHVLNIHGTVCINLTS